jgi:hypothetical protein
MRTETIEYRDGDGRVIWAKADLRVRRRREFVLCPTGVETIRTQRGAGSSQRI